METQQHRKLTDAILSGNREVYRRIYFYGDAAHITPLLDDLETQYRTRNPTAAVTRITAQDFCSETIRNVQSGDLDTPNCDCDLYIFEEIGQIAGMKVTEERLYGILDRLQEHDRQIIVTGSVPTAGMHRLAPRIRAQLDGGISFPVTE